MSDSNAVHIALRTRAESAAGFPALREHENADFSRPTDGSMYSEEDFIPQPGFLGTAVAKGGWQYGRGVYVIRLFAAVATGSKALRDTANAICAQFPIAWAQTVTDGTILRTRNDFLANAGQITNVPDTGMAYVVITIPYKTEVRLAA